MKLILLLIVFATNIVFIHADDPPIIFKTDFHCQEHTGKWCASAFFYEIDSSSFDDAVLYFHFCSENQTKTVSIKVDPLGGDGGVFGLLQDEYEFGYKIFHNCTSSGQACSVHKAHQSVRYNTDNVQTVYNSLYWPRDSLDRNSVACEFPKDAFHYIPKYGSDIEPLSKYFVTSMDKITSDKLVYWTESKYGPL